MEKKKPPKNYWIFTAHTDMPNADARYVYRIISHWVAYVIIILADYIIAQILSINNDNKTHLPILNSTMRSSKIVCRLFVLWDVKMYTVQCTRTRLLYPYNFSAVLTSSPSKITAQKIMKTYRLAAAYSSFSC